MQQPPGGTHVKGDECIRITGARVFGTLHGGGDHLLVVFIFFGVDAEGICGDDVAAGLQISTVQRGDFFRFGQIPHLRRRACGQSHALQHGAGAAVKKQTPAVQCLQNLAIFFHLVLPP